MGCLKSDYPRNCLLPPSNTELYTGRPDSVGADCKPGLPKEPASWYGVKIQQLSSKACFLGYQDSLLLTLTATLRTAQARNVCSGMKAKLSPPHTHRDPQDSKSKKCMLRYQDSLLLALTTTLKTAQARSVCSGDIV